MRYEPQISGDITREGQLVKKCMHVTNIHSYHHGSGHVPKLEEADDDERIEAMAPQYVFLREPEHRADPPERRG